jgi:hypothetical protein
MFENEEIKIFKVTLKNVLQRLAKIENCDIKDFKNIVADQFDGYNYEGEEELIGFDLWDDITKDGEYKLSLKIDHEDAYEFTLYVKITNNKATIYNIL